MTEIEKLRKEIEDIQSEKELLLKKINELTEKRIALQIKIMQKMEILRKTYV